MMDHGSHYHLRSAKKLQVCNNNSKEDRISQLPDDILGTILSPLPLTEAGRTSVLSRRWRHVWKSTGRLIFAAPKEMLKIFRVRSYRKARSMYISWVNKVVKQLQHDCPSSIQEFRVGFDMDRIACKDVVKWIKFMTSKRVETLDITFGFFKRSNSFTLTRDCDRYLRLFNCLRSLSLHYVNISKKLLNYFLSECTHLETFSITFSTFPKRFEVKVTSPSLQKLEMFSCDELSNIELSAPKLATFSFWGPETEFLIGSNPCLTSLSLQEGNNKNMLDVLFAFSKHVPHLETLRMPSFFLNKYRLNEVPRPRLSQLKSLKHLELEVSMPHRPAVIVITTFIMAAPFLNTFTLQFKWSTFVTLSRIVLPDRQIHQSLKVVKLLGFIGCLTDLGIATHLLNIAINLERIVIEPHVPNEFCYYGGFDMDPDTFRKRSSEGLKDHLSPATRLIIL